MFEGYSCNKYNATGLVQWMLNSAWPSNMWHLFDYFLQTGGSYFGVKKAISQPLHLLYAYDLPEMPTHPPSAADRAIQVSQAAAAAVVEGARGTVSIVNSLYEPDGDGLTAEATQFNLSGVLIHRQTHDLAKGGVGADATLRLFRIDSVVAASNATVLLRLRLRGGHGGSENWYWLPPRQDTFEMGGCFTGCKIDQVRNEERRDAMRRYVRRVERRSTNNVCASSREEKRRERDQYQLVFNPNIHGVS